MATTSSGVAESLGYEDGEETPADEMLAAVQRIARVVDVPVTADLEGGYGLDPRRPRAADGRRRRGRPELRGHRPRDAPRLHDVGAQAERIAALKAAQDLVVNARIDVFLNGGAVADGLERARAYADAGADCVYPIGITDEATIAAFVDARHARQRRALARPRRRSSGWPSSASPGSASATSSTPRCSPRWTSAWPALSRRGTRS